MLFLLPGTGAEGGAAGRVLRSRAPASVLPEKPAVCRCPAAASGKSSALMTSGRAEILRF